MTNKLLKLMHLQKTK